MFSLCHQVTCDERRIALRAHDDGFGRTSQELNGAIERDQLLAAVTYRLPGPTILLTRGMLSVP